MTRRLVNDLKATWGCFSCRNPRIFVEHKKCPVCHMPRLNRKFGLLVEGFGHFLCHIETGNLILKLSFVKVGDHGRQMIARSVPIAGELEEADWKDAAYQMIILQHVNPDLARHDSAGQPAQTMSLFEQVMFNAQRAKTQPDLLKSPKPIKPSRMMPRHRIPQAVYAPKAATGFRYLQQMRQEQVTMKKVVQKVIDRRSSADSAFVDSELDMDLPQPGEKKDMCLLCERCFPSSQLPGRISSQAVQRWKSQHGIDAADNDSESSYYRAFSMMKRQSVVPLCVFCSQFFDENAGEVVEKELVKQSMGVEDIIKGPLNRANHYYEGQLRSIASQSLVGLAADTGRPRSRLLYKMAVEQLRSRSTQRISSVAQFKHMNNKYFDVNAAQPSVSSTDKKPKGGKPGDVSIERRYHPIVQIPKKFIKRKPKASVSVVKKPSNPVADELEADKRKELENVFITKQHDERSVGSRQTRSLSPVKQKKLPKKSDASRSPSRKPVPMRSESRKARGISRSLSPVKQSKTRRSPSRKANPKNSGKRTGSVTRKEGLKAVKASPAVAPVDTPPASRPSEELDNSLDSHVSIAGPLLPPIRYSNEPAIPSSGSSSARKPVLFAMKRKGGQGLVVDALVVSASMQQSTELTEATPPSESQTNIPILRGKQRFKLIRSQQLEQIRAAKEREAHPTCDNHVIVNSEACVKSPSSVSLTAEPSPAGCPVQIATSPSRPTAAAPMSPSRIKPLAVAIAMEADYQYAHPSASPETAEEDYPDCPKDLPASPDEAYSSAIDAFEDDVEASLAFMDSMHGMSRGQSRRRSLRSAGGGTPIERMKLLSRGSYMGDSLDEDIWRSRSPQKSQRAVSSGEVHRMQVL